MNSTALVILCILAIPGAKMAIEKTWEITKGIGNAYKISTKKVEVSDPDEMLLKNVAVLSKLVRGSLGASGIED